MSRNIYSFDRNLNPLACRENRKAERLDGNDLPYVSKTCPGISTADNHIL